MVGNDWCGCSWRLVGGGCLVVGGWLWVFGGGWWMVGGGCVVVVGDGWWVVACVFGVEVVKRRSQRNFFLTETNFCN